MACRCGLDAIASFCHTCERGGRCLRLRSEKAHSLVALLTYWFFPLCPICCSWRVALSIAPATSRDRQARPAQSEQLPVRPGLPAAGSSLPPGTAKSVRQQARRTGEQGCRSGRSTASSTPSTGPSSPTRSASAGRGAGARNAPVRTCSGSSTWATAGGGMPRSQAGATAGDADSGSGCATRTCLPGSASRR
jgi:hypothetical protein